MKFLPLFCFLSLLVLFNTKPLQGAEPETVIDMLDKPVIAGYGYHVWQVSGGFFGGLSLRNKTCPLDVVRVPNAGGSPVYFSAPGIWHTPTETDLTVEIPIVGSPCEESKIWKLSKVGYRLWYVSTGGVAGDVNSKFKIEKLQTESPDPFYFFKFCPSDPGASCAPVGIYTDIDGTTRVLAVGDYLAPYLVRFERVRRVSAFPQEI